MHPKEERTCIIVKPDGVKRGLIGEVLKRVEQRGLKIIGLKMLTPDRKFIEDFLPKTEQWLIGMGKKTLDTYAQYNKDPIKEIGTSNALEIGKKVKEWLIEFWISGPVVAVCVSGIHAIDMVRKIVGKTFPIMAEMGTIRGDYSVDSPVLANMDKRAIHNIVHASGNPEEAEHEIKHWFKKEEIHFYKRAEEDVMF